MTVIETDTTSTESEDDDILLDQINIVLETIKSMCFDGPQCLIQRLQNHLPVKCLTLSVPRAPLFLQSFAIL